MHSLSHQNFIGFKAVRARAVRAWSSQFVSPTDGLKRPLHVSAQRLRCVGCFNSKTINQNSAGQPAAPGNAASGKRNLASQLMESGTNFPVRELRFRDKIRFELATQN